MSRSPAERARAAFRDCFGAAISTDGHGLRFDTTIDGRDVRVWRAATSTDPWLDQFDKPGVPSPRVKGRSGGMVWSWKGQPSVAQDAALRHELRSCLS